MSLTIFARVTETSASTRSRTWPSKAEIASASDVASGKRASGSLAMARSRMSRSSGGRSGRSVSTLGGALGDDPAHEPGRVVVVERAPGR